MFNLLFSLLFVLPVMALSMLSLELCRGPGYPINFCYKASSTSVYLDVVIGDVGGCSCASRWTPPHIALVQDLISLHGSRADC